MKKSYYQRNKDKWRGYRAKRWADPRVKENDVKRGIALRRNRKLAYMADKKCVTCETNKRLHLHHVDPKSKTIQKTSDIWGWTEKRRLAEIAKCEIRCTSCHAKIHNQMQREASLKKHGQLRAWRLGCRCGLCRGVRSLYDRYYQRYKQCLSYEMTNYIFNLSNLMVCNGNVGQVTI
jgi:hypothetical protein